MIAHDDVQGKSAQQDAARHPAVRTYNYGIMTANTTEGYKHWYLILVESYKLMVLSCRNFTGQSTIPHVHSIIIDTMVCTLQRNCSPSS